MFYYFVASTACVAEGKSPEETLFTSCSAYIAHNKICCNDKATKKNSEGQDEYFHFIRFKLDFFINHPRFDYSDDNERFEFAMNKFKPDVDERLDLRSFFLMTIYTKGFVSQMDEAVALRIKYGIPFGDEE